MTIAIKLGRAVGYSAAAVAHGACVAASYTGQFGSDLVSSTASSYASNTERLAAQRAQFKAKPLSIKVSTVRAKA